MKVLYISYDGVTDPLGQSQVIPYLTGLSKKNKITIISCEKKERYEKYKHIILNILNKYGIDWIPVSYSTLPSILSKQWNIFRLKKQAVLFCKTHHPDIVHCRSYMASLIGLALKKKFNTRFIFDMRGFWADERIDGHIWSKENFIHRLLYDYFKKKEIEFLQNADFTISLTENARKEILSWKQLKNQPIPIEVIPCCADLEHFSLATIDEQEKLKLREKLNISENDLIISYLGSIGTWYMLDEMLDFFSCAIVEFPRSKFLFITPDDGKFILNKALAKGIRPEQLIITSASRSEVPLYLSLSAISIYFIRPSYSKRASSPTKTAEILGLGIPIITNPNIGDSSEIIENSGTGLIVTAFQKEIYTEIIKQFSLLLSIDKNKMINVSRQHFSIEKGVELYQSVYTKVK